MDDDESNLRVALAAGSFKVSHQRVVQVHHALQVKHVCTEARLQCKPVLQLVVCVISVELSKLGLAALCWLQGADEVVHPAMDADTTGTCTTSLLGQIV